MSSPTTILWLWSGKEIGKATFFFQIKSSLFGKRSFDPNKFQQELLWFNALHSLHYSLDSPFFLVIANLKQHKSWSYWSSQRSWCCVVMLFHFDKFLNDGSSHSKHCVVTEFLHQRPTESVSNVLLQNIA